MSEKYSTAPHSETTLGRIGRIGFIGLGLMGRPMARNLANAGLDLIVYSRSQGPIDALLAECPEVKTGTNPAEIAQRADIIIMMLSDTPAVEMVLQAEHGILSALRPGSLIIDMGTTDTLITRELAIAVEAKGGSYVDGPVSGGTLGADTGELVIMTGGTVDALSRAQPIFDILGKQSTHVGTSGAGQVAKAANQIIVGLTIGAVSEALALSNQAGVDPARVREALKGGFADSRILEVHGKRMVDHTFAPGGKCTTQRKDLDQGISLGQSLDLDLPATVLCRNLYDRMIENGHGDLDHSALIMAIDPDWTTG